MSISSISSYMIYSPVVANAARTISNADNEAQKAENEKAQAVEEAVNNKVLEEDDSTKKKDTVSASSTPWATLMYKLNLTPTGVYEDDYNNTVTRLNELIKYTQNPTKLKEYLALTDEINIAFAQSNSNSHGSTNVSAMSGSEQIAQLNRVMMLNMKATSS